uniref:DNA endonuclease activator Ctp1 C-terminal domain-containing protein n=2 Tax=Strongyloides stercoralis TaxID=6248 RepID=A0AAF5I204_STRER
LHCLSVKNDMLKIRKIISEELTSFIIQVDKVIFYVEYITFIINIVTIFLLNYQLKIVKERIIKLSLFSYYKMTSMAYTNNDDIKEQLIEILDQSMRIKSCFQTILFDFAIIIVCIAFLSVVLMYYSGKLFYRKYKELIDFELQQNNIYYYKILKITQIFEIFFIKSLKLIMASLDQIVLTVDKSFAELTQDISRLIRVLTICIPFIIVFLGLLFLTLVAVLFISFYLQCMNYKNRTVERNCENGINDPLFKK